MGNARVVLVTEDQGVVLAVADAVEAGGGVLTVSAGGVVPAGTAADLFLVGADLLLGKAVPPLLEPELAYAVTAGAPVDPAVWRAVGERGLAGVVELPQGGPWLAQRLQARQADAEPLGPALVVLSAVGGAGASTTAAALAVLAAEGGPVVAVDGDPGPAGLESLLGLVDAPPHLPRFAAARGRLTAGDLAGLPMAEGVRLLGWAGQPPEGSGWSGCLPALLPACRAAGGTAVIDVGTRLELLPLLPGDAHAVLVAPARLRAVAVATHVLADVQSRFARTTVLLRDVGGRAAPMTWARHWRGQEVLLLEHDPRAVDDENHGRPPGTRRRSSTARALRRVLAAGERRAA